MGSPVLSNAIRNPRNSETRFWNGVGLGATQEKIGELPVATPVVATAELRGETQTPLRGMASVGVPERQEMSGIGASMVDGPEPQYYYEMPAHDGALPHGRR